MRVCMHESVSKFLCVIVGIGGVINRPVICSILFKAQWLS